MVDGIAESSVSVRASFEAFYSTVVAHLPSLLVMLGVLAVTWLAGRMVFSATRRVLARRSTAGHVDILVARFARGCVWAVGLVVALAAVEADLAAIAASLGVAGLTLGFALRDVLANSVSGVLLLIQRPFRIGDSIAVAGTEGVVDDVRVRDTVVRMADGRRAYIPNTVVFNNVVVNGDDLRRRRFEIIRHVGSASDLEKTRVLLLDAVSGTSGVLGEPAPSVTIAAVGPRWARIVVNGWVDTATDGLDGVRSAALRATLDVLPASAEQG